MLVTSLFVVFGYLAGSISTAILVCRAMGLPDPRSEGSRNPGATNVLRFGGKKAAGITLAGDFLKGLLPVLLARWAGLDETGLALTALAALATWLFMAFVVRISSLAALTAAALAPLFAWRFGMWGVPFAAVLLMVALLVWRHRSNIRNLLAGAEDQIGTDRPEG